MIIRFIFKTLFVLLLVSCGKESPVEVLTPQTIKYNVTFTTGSGGSVSIPGGSYDSGSSVSVTATPNSEYVFVNWSNGSIQNPLSVTVTSNQSITANFEKRKYPLTVSITGSGTVSEEIISAGKTTTEYASGSIIQLTANPSEGWGFSVWSGTVSSTENPIQLTVDEAKSITSTFLEFPVPTMTLVSSQTKMFTKGVADTLLISINSGGGFKSVELSSDWGDISSISSPEEGSLEGNLVVQYQPSQIKNVDYTRTIAGSDNLLITLTDQNDLTLTVSYTFRTQPEPIFKNYLQTSHNLFTTRNRADLNLIRYLNQRDNSFEMFCDGDETNYYNTSGNYFDELAGVGYADFNGDGYDDILLHPTYTTYRFGGFSTVKMEYELYIYTDGEYKYSSFDWGGKEPPKSYLGRKIIVGDYDNDGDPDVFVASLGLDIPPYTGEPSKFIINNLNTNQTFDYKEIDLVSGAHTSSSADIDGDGDLDIFVEGSRDSSPQKRIASKFLINNGNFDLSIWEDVISSNNDPFWGWKGTYVSELEDVDKDGFIDLIVMGHEWDYMYDWCTDKTDGTCGRGKIYWGDENGRFDETRKSLIPIVRNFGVSTDIDIIDVDGNGVNEIIVTRAGGDIDSFPIDTDNMNENFSESNGFSYFYGGHYIQISKLTENREIIDVSSELIDENVNSNQLSMCSPSDAWFIHTRVEDYNGNGSINIFNSLVSYRDQHIWEWNGSKFIKITDN